MMTAGKGGIGRCRSRCSASPLVVNSQGGPEGSSSEAVLAYREAANFQNNGAFEVAAEEWQKFLEGLR